jgi:hypothetical protein
MNVRYERIARGDVIAPGLKRRKKLLDPLGCSRCHFHIPWNVDSIEDFVSTISYMGGMNSGITRRAKSNWGLFY